MGMITEYHPETNFIEIGTLLLSEIYILITRKLTGSAFNLNAKCFG